MAKVPTNDFEALIGELDTVLEAKLQVLGTVLSKGQQQSGPAARTRSAQPPASTYPDASVIQQAISVFQTDVNQEVATRVRALQNKHLGRPAQHEIVTRNKHAGSKRLAGVDDASRPFISENASYISPTPASISGDSGPITIQTMNTGTKPKKRRTTKDHSYAAPSSGIPTEVKLALDLIHPRVFIYLCRLINAWRRQSQRLYEPREGHSSQQQAANLVHIIRRSTHAGFLSTYLSRLAKVELSELIDGQRRKKHLNRATPVIIKDIAVRAGFPGDSLKERRDIKGYISEGRKWNRLCAGMGSLLAMIPPLQPQSSDHPTGTSGLVYLHLAEESHNNFRQTLLGSHMGRAMLAMCEAVQTSIVQGRDLPRFVWQDTANGDLATVSRTNIPDLCKVFQVITTNYFDESKFQSEDARPLLFTGPWPSNPTIIPQGELQCSICDTDQACACISDERYQSESPFGLHIKSAGDTGEGVFALRNTPDNVSTVYKTGDILGQLVGELEPYVEGVGGKGPKPRGSRALGNRMVWHIVMEDGDNRDALCLINCRFMGNWARKLNHSCSPVVQFDERRISGAWRIIIVALRDVIAGEELTVSYGRGFFKDRCLCNPCVKARS